MMEPVPAVPATLPPPRHGAASRLLAALALFLSGLVFGAGGAALVIRHAAQRAVRNPEVRPERAMRWLGRRLDLDEAQRKKVRAIFQRQAAEMEGLRLGVWPRLLERLKATEREIDETLRPDQREKWRKIVERLERNWLPPDGGAGRPN